MRRGSGAAWMSVAVFLAAAPADAEFTGVVFVDQDADGLRGEAEPGLAGVAVSNGFDVVRTDEDGSYRLPERTRQGPDDGVGGFVFATRPDGYSGASWYAEGGGDLALVPMPAPAPKGPGDVPDSSGEGMFFIHFSDAHVYDRTSDFRAYSAQGRWWIPEIVQNWIALQFAGRILAPFTDDPGDGLRQALAPYRDEAQQAELAEAWDTTVLSEFLAEFDRPDSALGNVTGRAEASFREMKALNPGFYVVTGDLVLEGNDAPPEPVDRWFAYYKRLRDGLGAPVFDTIGNNEIAGTGNDTFARDDPRFGKHFFREVLGPTQYSFDRGEFHFVALDTHFPKKDEPGRWSWGYLSDDEKVWLARDLEAHAGKTVVVLNHEPFHYDPSWPFDPDPDQGGHDEGLFAKHGVAYSLAGHTHLNGFEEKDGTTHITTGALSGFRWVLPSELYHSGYRLFYARDGKLYSAWKRTGRPLLAFIHPKGDGASHPASAQAPDPEALDGPIEIVAVAADFAGPFPGIRLELDGVAVEFERWGDYFLRARIDPAEMKEDTGMLTLSAITLDGRFEKAELPVERVRRAAN